MTITGSILLLGFGNPARGDDGLGPALAHVLTRRPLVGVHTMWDYQPAVEHAAELAEHDIAILADASLVCPAPFRCHELLPRPAESFTTHHLAPEAVVSLAQNALGWRGRAYLLGIRGYAFEPFCEALSQQAQENLRLAALQLRACIASGTLDPLLTDAPSDHSDHGGATWLSANT